MEDHNKPAPKSGKKFTFGFDALMDNMHCFVICNDMQ